MTKYKEYKKLDFPAFEEEVLKFWKEQKIFEKSVTTREGKPAFVFYEGPPSANGMPGIHHVMARAVKDIFCRYKTLKGFQVKRKGGWDTHGLPIELQVEKRLGITKDDIGKTISVAEYNAECRKDVMQFKDVWDNLTDRMGYWVDLKDPYITYENDYIETLWFLLKKLYNKNLLYKGYTIQPYSPAAGTGLSSHELNQPGTYKDVKDTTVVAQFKIVDSSWLSVHGKDLKEVFFLAWTTTPWTLPSNCALAVGEKIDYVVVNTFNQYTHQPITVILAENLLDKHFKVGSNLEVGSVPLNEYITSWLRNSNISENIKSQIDAGGNAISNEFEDLFRQKRIPYFITKKVKGKDLGGIRYEQLLPFVKPDNGDAFKVIIGDFVTTEDGTGIVHIAPSFGADDFRVAKQNGIGSLTLVDKRGKFLPEVNDGIFLYGNEYVKEEYLTDEEKKSELEIQKEKLKGFIKDTSNLHYLSVDERIALKLQHENKLFKKEKYEHTYPHCWRTDKPILYYPLESWFIKTTAAKDRLVELNKTINWKPEHTGTGRFGNWLENLVDWNLSRSRYWGTPLPIWSSILIGGNEIVVGSVEDLKSSISIKGLLKGEKFNGYFIKAELKEITDGVYNHNPEKEKILRKILLDGGDSNETIETKINCFKLALINKPNALSFIPTNQIKRFLIPVSELNKSEMDLHKPFVDDIVFLIDGYESKKDFVNNILIRESDLIDVWFDSGAMPYAQWHFMGKENTPPFDKNGAFPADFIAEGVDQTRGWFFTLHAISVLLFDSVSYKNVIANGLVLDKNGNKMSKRLNNAVDPFETIAKYGADATRFYMLSNSDPWDNLKFDIDGVAEIQRKFFATLYNVYSFFALYANLDGFTFSEKEIPINERPEIDRWILSLLNSLIKKVELNMEDYDPTPATRAIYDFVGENLSNWYVRLCRRRFWKGEYSLDKISAYQTLYTCLETVAKLMSPIAPFYSETLFRDLNNVTKKNESASVHLTNFPSCDEKIIDIVLEEQMQYAQKISSLALSIRKKENIKVRQPLQKILIPVVDIKIKDEIVHVKDLILSEINVKELEFIDAIDKSVKANFRVLGKKVGTKMKQVAEAITKFSQQQIQDLEQNGSLFIDIEDNKINIQMEDVEILSKNIEGYMIANEGKLTVALDINISESLKEEGIARELVSKLQNLRKDCDFKVSDKINVKIFNHPYIINSIKSYKTYICTEILASEFELTENLSPNAEIEVDENPIKIQILKA